MGFRLAVSGGAENISLDERTIEKVSFGSDSATDSNARGVLFPPVPSADVMVWATSTGPVYRVSGP